jgi:hypothetical protein
MDRVRKRPELSETAVGFPEKGEKKKEHTVFGGSVGSPKK